MAGRVATKSFEDRMFSGGRVSAALSALGISQERFLEQYNTVEIPRTKPSEKLAAANARIAELEAQLSSQEPEKTIIRKAKRTEESGQAAA